jgi:NAD(P)-dependent dehydrogenase (short-subunit alcohol dehydrogenase family)
MSWKRDLQGEVVLITGAAERVGAAIAVGLAEAGAVVAVNHWKQHDLALETVKEIERLGRVGAVFEADVSDVAATRKLVDEVVERFGRLDVVIHNASTYVRAPFLDLTEADFEASIGVGLRGPLFLSQAAARVMKAQGTGKIIALIGNSLYEAWPNYVSHSVAKAALTRLMQVLSVALSPEIQCLAIAPGKVLWTSELHDKNERGVRESSEDGACQVMPAGNLRIRTGTVTDLAELVLMLCEASPYLNGAVIPLDGGMSNY